MDAAGTVDATCHEDRDMRLIIAGGGTGGHLFPGVALAEELRSRDPAAAVRFVGTARGIEARVLPALGWELVLIEVSGLKTVGALGALRGLFRLPRALLQARRVVREFSPDVVVGVGGYASGPVVLMARLMGVRTAILEQNSLPGLANKILGRVVHAVFLAFAETRRFFKPSKILMTGNPIRRDIRLALQAAGAAAEGGMWMARRRGGCVFSCSAARRARPRSTTSWPTPPACWLAAAWRSTSYIRPATRTWRRRARATRRPAWPRICARSSTTWPPSTAGPTW